MDTGVLVIVAAVVCLAVVLFAVVLVVRAKRKVSTDVVVEPEPVEPELAPVVEPELAPVVEPVKPVVQPRVPISLLGSAPVPVKIKIKQPKTPKPKPPKTPKTPETPETPETPKTPKPGSSSGGAAVGDAVKWWSSQTRPHNPRSAADFEARKGSDGRTYVVGSRDAVVGKDAFTPGTEAAKAAEVARMVEMNRRMRLLRDRVKTSALARTPRGKAVLDMLNKFADEPVSRIGMANFGGSWGWSGGGRVWFTTYRTGSSSEDMFHTVIHEFGHVACNISLIGDGGKCGGPPYYENNNSPTHGEDWGRVVNELRAEALKAGLIRRLGNRTCEGDDLAKCKF
jgi:outer membrane biosynthesis protein TonB